MNLIRLFQILAVVLLGAAAYFYSRDDKDAAFAAAVLGVCAFFLNIRFQIKARVDARRALAENDALVDDEPNG
jgi:cellobiose-specific phosphotransferase system component IIC